MYIITLYEHIPANFIVKCKLKVFFPIGLIENGVLGCNFQSLRANLGKYFGDTVDSPLTDSLRNDPSLDNAHQSVTE